MKQVIKRNGSVVPFDILKIAGAIYKTRKDNGLDIKIDQCEEEAWKIVESLKDREEPVPIEDIQDAIEDYFFTNGEMKIFKSFVFYREKRAAERKTPWKDTDERQDMILGKYLIKGETKKEFLDRISNGNHNLLKIFRSREAIWGGRILYAIGREGNITGSNCFIKGTKVLTKKGYKKIEEIEKNEEVFTQDGTYQIVNETMINKHKGQLIKLNSKYFNSITCTPEHPFLTQEGWIEAKDLSFKKRSSKKAPHFIKFKKLNLDEEYQIELELKEILKELIGEEFILEEIENNKLQPKVKHLNKGTLCFTKSTISSVNKNIILDKDLAYVLGRYAGDGSITKRKNTRHNLYSIFQIVGNESEKEILDRCADIIENKFDVKVRRQYTSGKQKTYIIKVDSIVISEFFNYFVGHGFDNKFIHNDIKKFPSFFYGVFDSDGSINNRSSGSITMNNESFIKELKEMADIFGIPTYIGKKVNSMKQYRDYPMLNIPKNSLSLIIDKLNKKYEDDRVEKCVPYNLGDVRIINGEAYIKLDSIENIENQEVDVYNLSVEKNHDYVVENIHVHNCYVATAPEDSLKDIYRADYDIARTYSYGGGQGLNLSKLRPRGAKVNNTSNTTPGIMVFADKYSHTTLNTQQESRRGALMLVLNIDHPDVIDFITAKLDLNKINGANISLAITDDFMKAYKADELWTMKFETPYEKIEKVVKARDLMSLVSYAAHTMGDPKININPNLCCLNN